MYTPPLKSDRRHAWIVHEPRRSHSTSIMFQLPSGSWGELLLTSRLSIFRVQLRHWDNLSTVRIHHRAFWMESGLLYDRHHRYRLVPFLVLLRLRHASCASQNISAGATIHTRQRSKSSSRKRGKWLFSPLRYPSLCATAKNYSIG